MRVEHQGTPGSLLPVHMGWVVPPGSMTLLDGAMHYLDVMGSISPVPGQVRPSPPPPSSGASRAAGHAAVLATTLALALAAAAAVGE